MKRLTAGWLAALLLAIPLALSAQPETDRDRVLDNDDVEQEVEEGGKRIYRTVDRHGNPVFTDNRPDSGPVLELELPPANTLPMERARPGMQRVEAEAVAYRLSIASPENEQTFQNPSEPILVQVRLSPRLEPNHRLEVTANGEPLPGSLGEGFVYRQPERGEHRIVVRLLEDGQVLESDEVIIYVHRASALRQPDGAGEEGDRRREGYTRDEYPGRAGYNRGDYPGRQDYNRGEYPGRPEYNR